MRTLLEAFKAATPDRLYVTSYRIVKYADKHPMATCLLDAYEQNLVAAAHIVYRDCQANG